MNMALVEGMQYCLSQGSYSENRSLIFVKLTDSALRAIGELTKSRNNSSSFYPSIHFQGNQGVISLPRPQATNSESCQKFGFNLSNVEAEGPQGSFECIRQTGSGSLQSLGCMVHKMHIHANEESYESTRVKMVSVEKERKKDCTKEIKASGPYACVRRKVKVKRPMSSLISVSKAPSPSSMPSLPSLPPVSRPIPKMTNYTGVGSNNVNSSTNVSSSASSSSHFRPSSTAASNVPALSPVVNSSSSSQQVAGSGSSSSSGAPPGPAPPSAPPPPPHPPHPPVRAQHGNPDIMRRSYRERVIHLLALRPYKKPELLARLMKDGIKEKDKKGLSALLSKVAQAKDNTYSLARYCWTEVAEDWPFYTHEEKELLKRRKPQNATPPNETDHPSPTAIHSSQSPPFSNSQSQKRPPSKLEPDYNNVQQPKKQRISHYITNGSSTNSVSAGGSTSNSSSNNGGYTLSSRLADPSVLTLCASSNKMERNASGRKVESPTSAPPNPWTNRNRTEGRSPNPSENNARTPNNLQQRSQTPTNLRNTETFAATSQSQRRSPPPPTNQSRLTNSSKASRNSENNNGLSNNSSSGGEWNASSRQQSSQKSPPSRLISSSARESKYPNGGTGANSTLSSSSAAKMGGRPRINPASANAGSAGSRGSSPQSSPESQDSVEYRASSSLNSSPNSSEIPDYVSKYVGITNRDQRAKYKADFNAEYNEYRKLHANIEQVKRRFEALEDDLHGSITGSQEWHRIRSQIVQEYEDNNRGHHYRDSKRRLNYLHDKLSHIKRLVVEYDQSPAQNGGNNHHQIRGPHQGHRVRVHHHSRAAHPPHQQRHHRQQVATA